MNGILRYSGIAAISVSLIMLSLGSLPTTNAQSVGSVLTVTLSCGLLPTGDAVIDFDTIIDPTGTTTLNSGPSPPSPGNDPINQALTGVPPTYTNNGNSNAIVTANSGTVPTGGYLASGVTAIPPSQMSLGFEGGPLTALSNAGAETSVGTIVPTATGILQLAVLTTAVSGTYTTTSWTATNTLTVSCTLVVP